VLAYIAVASNIDPRTNILQALDLLMERVRVAATSTFYQTPAINRPEQPAYLDGVWQIETPVPPHDLKFNILRDIEDRLGRTRTSDKYAARTIDLDILLYGNMILDDVDCRIPAPEIRDRPFLVACLLELDPELVLPDTREQLESLVKPHEMRALLPDAELTARVRSRLDPRPPEPNPG